MPEPDAHISRETKDTLHTTRSTDAAPDTAPDTAKTRPRVMVVEDDPFIAIDLEDTLSAAGFEVDGPYCSAREACRALHDAPLPDLVTLDYRLSDTTSDVVAAMLARARIPFLLVSSEAPDTLARMEGNPPSLTKPFRPASLVRRMRELLPA